ncbi:MAG: single-stranded-DNA-specific exonuclease RecJ [Desulfobulbus sp.]|nr:single-stranded-DNA-specific exonuclease RecJ [Desulfobulbus sp.]
MPQPSYIFSPDANSPQTRRFGAMVAKNFRLPQQLGEILYIRGIDTLQAVEQFLHPQLAMLPPPESMRGMSAAVALVLTAYRKKLPILIHGDYDVDGITSTTLLTAFFREIGIFTAYVIPNRLEERYGLSKHSIRRLLHQVDQPQRGGILITVDCGISAVEEVDYARQQGLQVIITDHHEPQAELPQAEAILNPKQHNCTFPFNQLAGVGVAFFLVMALRKAFTEQGILDGTQINLKKYLDLVALGTVADVVPLVGINRVLVRAGLEVLSGKQRPGVHALCQRCGIADREILAEDISFKLAPRINASGRLGEPIIGVELLLAETSQDAQEPADALDRFNVERKTFEILAIEAIEENCQQQLAAGREGLAIYQQGCHPGVLGIVASRIAERFGRPVIIFTDEQVGESNRCLKGSGRSVTGIHLFQLLEQCKEFINQYGGHAMAIGLTIEQDNLEKFAQLFNQQVCGCGEVLGQGRGIEIDYHFTERKHLTKNFARALQRLQPFGEGNPEPTFLLSSERLVHPKRSNGHLRFQVLANGHVFPGIGFHLAQSGHNYQSPHDLVFHLKRSWFRGIEQDQLQAIHVVSP